MSLFFVVFVCCDDGKWSVRAKSGNKGQSLRSTVSHHPHVSSVITIFIIIQWVVRLYQQRSKGRLWVCVLFYILLLSYKGQVINKYTLIVCPITSFVFSNYFYCECFSTGSMLHLFIFGSVCILQNVQRLHIIRFLQRKILTDLFNIMNVNEDFTNKQITQKVVIVH